MAKTETNKPVLTLDTISKKNPPIIIIDDVDYHLIEHEDLGPKGLSRYGFMGARLDKLLSLSNMSDKQEAEAEKLATEAVLFISDIPENVLKGLSFQKRLSIVNVFTQVSGLTE